MRCNAVVLSDGHIYQLIKTIGANKIKTFLELGIKTTMEAILLPDIRVCMVSGVLAQMIKDLCILQHRAVSLGQCQELIHLPVHESFGNMMRPEGGPEFIPVDYMVSRQCGAIIVPPDASSAT